MLQLNCPLSVNLEIDFIILPSLWIQWGVYEFGGKYIA